jgi:hypothetical protein
MVSRLMKDLTAGGYIGLTDNGQPFLRRPLPPRW